MNDAQLTFLCVTFTKFSVFFTGKVEFLKVGCRSILCMSYMLCLSNNPLDAGLMLTPHFVECVERPGGFESPVG